MIIFSSIIPISLRVNLDMGKTLFSWLIMRDKKIPETVVRTSTIPEELGRISYLLTDKTGTLTKNEMELKKLHLGTLSFGSDSMFEVGAYIERELSDPVDQRSQRGIAARVVTMVSALSVCHNVTPTFDDNGAVTYQASSPDEIAIVRWTQQMGFALIFRDLNIIRVRAGQHFFEYDIIETFPFTSDSKRMGILLRDRTKNCVMYVLKGADSVMKKFVVYNQWLDEECDNMARDGLRTLVVGMKYLSEEQLKIFQHKYHIAKTGVVARSFEMQRVISEYLECDLELLGLTGVEDKLQDEVKNTFEMLRNAGIKIWMLTGDKVETAQCIARSSKLISRAQSMYIISKCNLYSFNTVENSDTVVDELEKIGNTPDCCLVIDGESLQIILDSYPVEFINVSLSLPAVVCCRCSPTQKADIVKLINTNTNQRTCAIGDGGNDVSMIQTAHVGIGIVGKEGMNASLAADYSITQFSHITRLILWHGRNSYKRSAKLAHFVIHRGLIISVIQAVFSALFYFAPIALFNGFILVGYTTIYTMAPVFSLVYDKDISDETAILYPELYKDLRKVLYLVYYRDVPYLSRHFVSG